MIKKGIAVSSGLGLAKAYKHVELQVNVTSDLTSDTKGQLLKLEDALSHAEVEINASKQLASKIMSDDDSHIFDAHLAILRDEYFLDEVKELIKKGHYASFAYKKITDQYIDKMREIEDEYLNERSVDITDVYRKVMYYLKALSRHKIEINEPVVLVVSDLTPSDTLGLDFNLVKGIVSEKGGKTSHAAIIARTLGIPSVVGVNISNIYNDDLLLVDGRYGVVTIDPTDDELVEYAYYLDQIESKTERLKPYKDLKTFTKDGHPVKLGVNISHHDEMTHIKYAEGVGLYRTEFLFMSNTQIPSLDEQIKSYETILSSNQEEINIIRTLDIGGDKSLTYLPIKTEENPFLGQRAIRLSLANKNLFTTQLQALLLSNKWGNLGILLPMISTLDELLEAKELIESVKQDLISKGNVIKPYQLGVMVEVPIAALGIDEIIKEVDFVSIGSNDLIQYLFAADRMNEEVSYLYQPFHPVFLKLIKFVINRVHAAGKWVGVCGEMAGVKESALLLVGLGIDELSMSYASILEVREMIAQVTLDEAKQFAEEVMKMGNHLEISQTTREFVKSLNPKHKKDEELSYEI